jgi:thiol-disulfide isomerase/thioredoxin
VTRGTKIAIGVFIVLQIAAVAVYLAVESRRAKPLPTEPPRQIQGVVESFEVINRDGTKTELVGGDRPVLVHFWATWCKPCVEELPLVLALPDSPIRAVAVALDEDWSQIDTFAKPHPRIFRADAKTAEEIFELSSLPQTVLMMPDGRLVLRANGARNWADPVFWKNWTEALGL